jgi:phosphoribosylaminoimidazolecarboxamide formyltransferase / IMP cyclohydrolase
MTRYALLSVSDKTGLIDLAKALADSGYMLVSTGGTLSAIEKAGIPVTPIDALTGFPEILDGRVKTLHPKVHGGLLYRRDLQSHVETAQAHGIDPIDVVIVNLYPFKQTIADSNCPFEHAIENIDIGGPSMLRSAAKNHASVTVVCDPADYPQIIDELKTNGTTCLATREKLAAKVFRTTAAYDALIAEYLTLRSGESFPERLTPTFELKQTLRYGENPHQQAAFYSTPFPEANSLASCVQHHGKELSYNNIQDASAALALLSEFDEPCVVALKHTNPCGVGIADTIEEAWTKAYDADPVSIFGGVVAFNRPVTLPIANACAQLFLEILVAPSYEPEAMSVLTQKKNIRILTLSAQTAPRATQSLIKVSGGLLVQTPDFSVSRAEDVHVVTKVKPTDAQLKDLLFGEKVVKHVKSNAIVIVKDGQTLGVGAGQMNRVGAAKIALEQASSKAFGAVLASDAFFPMPDTVELAAQYGIVAILQPGGSLKDQDSIEACDAQGIAMGMTGTRHFKHG